ncbi:MAG: restriction endonuclease subunit S, partial [Oscillospiraceae bacterium]|nr:restriction endonuclease subunit S [Oscillospiraceae bacterium]
MTKQPLPNEWKNVTLKNIATPISEKVGNRTLETLSISAGIGFVNQAEKFGKELSGNQYEHYTVLHTGDFSYNKGNSKRYPQGCIYKLTDRAQAAVPNVFISFKINGQNEDFFEQLFISGYLNRQLKRIITSGARSDGLLNVSDKSFYDCVVPLPPLTEQCAIAEILTTVDKLIAAKERLIAAKQKQKRWLMQNLLTGKMRLPEFRGEWERVRLGKIADNFQYGLNSSSKEYDGENKYLR